MMSFFLDSLIVFLLIYAVIDLSHRALDYLTSLWFKDEEKAGILLLRLATLSPDNAEEILRRATKSGYSLWLLTDDAPHHILFMAEAICQSANDVCFCSQRELAKKLNLSKAPICFEEDNKEAVPTPDK